MSVKFETDENKNPVEIPVEVSVWAKKKSVWQREFYAAAAFDLRPEIIFVLWQQDYNGEIQVKYDDKDYQVIRSFEPNKEEIELYCSGPGPRPRSR